MGTPRKQKGNFPEIMREFDGKQREEFQTMTGGTHSAFQSEVENLYESLQVSDLNPYSKHA